MSAPLRPLASRYLELFSIAWPSMYVNIHVYMFVFMNAHQDLLNFLFRVGVWILWDSLKACGECLYIRACVCVCVCVFEGQPVHVHFILRSCGVSLAKPPWWVAAEACALRRITSLRRRFCGGEESSCPSSPGHWTPCGVTEILHTHTHTGENTAC